MRCTTLTILLTSVICSHQVMANDSPKTVCENAAALYSDGDVAGALEEAKWCVTLLEQEQQAKITSVFPDTVAGFTGAELENQNAMGFNLVSREYSKNNTTITVSLNGGSVGGAMEAFSALAQIGLSAGKKIRIQKRTASVLSENSQVQIMVKLKNGGMLNFETYDLSEQQAIEFAKAFPVEALDEARD